MTRIEYSDLLDVSLGKNFLVASRILDIRNQAERLAKQANKKQIANGEFATMFASNIQDWMTDLASVADKALARHLEQNATQKDDR